MRKLKQKLHLGHEENVPPSAAQASAYPATTTTPATTTPATTTPATTGLNQPYLGTASRGTAATGLVAPTTVVQQEKTIIEEQRPPLIEERTERVVVEERPIEQPIQPVTRFSDTAPVVEFREKAPVIQEVIKPGVREEIQPIVHRDREQLEIREELQPIYEKSVRPTLVEERELAPEFRPEVRTGVMPVLEEGPRSEVVVEREHVEVISKPAIVEEVVHKKIIEEVQPVIHREVIAPKVIREVQPIYEKVVEAPTVTYSTLPARYQQETRVASPPPRPIMQETITTTVTEKEFLPGTARAPMGTTGPLGAPTGLYEREREFGREGGYSSPARTGVPLSTVPGSAVTQQQPYIEPGISPLATQSGLGGTTGAPFTSQQSGWGSAERTWQSEQSSFGGASGLAQPGLGGASGLAQPGMMGTQSGLGSGLGSASGLTQPGMMGTQPGLGGLSGTSPLTSGTGAMPQLAKEGVQEITQGVSKIKMAEQTMTGAQPPSTLNYK